MIIRLKNFINNILFKLGYRISKINNSHELFKIHKDSNYDDYKKTQVFYNKKKINHIWADEENLIKICNFIKKNIYKDSIKGICHGSRNGFEQKIIKNNINNSEIIGTDISDNATKFENTFIWDFHKEKKEWINFFDFVYRAFWPMSNTATYENRCLSTTMSCSPRSLLSIYFCGRTLYFISLLSFSFSWFKTIKLPIN